MAPADWTTLPDHTESDHLLNIHERSVAPRGILTKLCLLDKDTLYSLKLTSNLNEIMSKGTNLHSELTICAELTGKIGKKISPWSAMPSSQNLGRKHSSAHAQ